jgi:hypothetical protein
VSIRSDLKFLVSSAFRSCSRNRRSSAIRAARSETLEPEDLFGPGERRYFFPILRSHAIFKIPAHALCLLRRHRTSARKTQPSGNCLGSDDGCRGRFNMNISFRYFDRVRSRECVRYITSGGLCSMNADLANTSKSDR